MDARERHAIEFDHDGEPKLYTFAPRPPWRDGDICVCGVKCDLHRDAEGIWIGCVQAKDAEGQR